ncbi:MAG TPA: hypothetical protein VJT09_17230 [Pyrinomonadaceae bacterium]|nr:hypothetical protein [Pyrinomonadaceae bacterium]
MKKSLVPRVALAAAVLFSMAALALPLPSRAASQRAEFMITNKSEWAIHHLYLSPEDKDTWGADQLGDNTIEPGESFTLKNIPCGEYDIKVVDEDGDECIIEGVVMCKDHTHWDITNKELAKCQGWGGE